MNTAYWQKGARAMLGLGLVSLLLSACGGNNNGGTASPSASSGSAASAEATSSAGAAPTESTEPVTIKIGNWPKPNDEANKQLFEDIEAQMKTKYPYVTIEHDEWGYDVVSFLPKAVSGQLPTLYDSFYTEADKIIKAKYSADITDMMKKYGYDTGINPELLKLVERDGKYYGLPKDGYVIGMMYNLNVFKEAGLVDANGVPQMPKTYEELAQTAVTIKEKTGKAGFFFPTKTNQGGWMFTNIAWSYGADFEEQDASGKWKAIFNSPEAVAALQYVKDLKWKYDVLPDNNLVDTNDLLMMFGADQVGMSFGMYEFLGPLVLNAKMSKDSLALSSMPSGPAGKAALLGGGLYMFAPGSTTEQLDAAFKWLELRGLTPKATPEALAALENNLKIQVDQGYVVGPHGLQIWTDPERVAAEQEIAAKYANVNMALFQDYMDNSAASMRPEPAVNAQELYKALDTVIQAVLTNKDADPQALLDRAVQEFQRDYLDKVQ
ncbi:type 2 periplasmic-binding domain-containing protein [Cohnella fermenti]|uniref:ABC transporter substrate-binding protein n=1 Tax=Cohnella fermenti TaxID=2565925 RepID=A0A4S4BGZ3_9BACL|nr:ABC transporter substrate-binding protein [Cohnella fermenti]THF73747.1 ABC transporter substrate-binding protein [Cohnella fermenti]